VTHFRVLPEFAAKFAETIPESERAAAVRSNLNKRLAHFTATRWRTTAPEFGPYEDCFPEIEKLLVAFEAVLPSGAHRVFAENRAFWEAQHPAI
jgi:hypothetical protein